MAFSAYRTTLLLSVISAALPFCACQDPDKIKEVRLEAGPGESGAGAGKEPSLRLSVAAMLSPKLSFVTYGELAGYLEKRLNLPVKLVFKKNYAETNESLKNSESDAAFLCTGGYLAAREAFGVDVLAVPVVDGKMVYNSLIVAPGNGPARGLRDLKGKVFAFSDKSSLTGRLYVRARLADLGLPSGFFGGTLLTGSYDNSIKAVAEDLADAACVNSLVYQALLGRGDRYAKKLKVLETSPPFGNPPMVARAGLPSELKNKLRAVFLDMHKDAEGRRVLRTLSVERFAAPPPGLYSSAEELFAKVSPGAGRRK